MDYEIIFSVRQKSLKLELLKRNLKLNHFALKAKLYLQALKVSMSDTLVVEVHYRS